MSRDHRKLGVFNQADALVIDIDKHSQNVPREEISGLTGKRDVRRYRLQRTLSKGARAAARA